MTTNSDIPVEPEEQQAEGAIGSTYTEYGPTATEAEPVSDVASDLPPAPSTPETTLSPPTDDPVTPVPNADPTLQQQQDEVTRQRREYEAIQERDKVISNLEQEALQMEQKLLREGYSDSEAKQQTMGHLEGRVNQIQQQRNAQQQVDVERGKRNASIHFAKKYNLGLETLGSLEQARNPKEMEDMAKTISTMDSQRKEIAELKSRLAPQQSFDTNTPSPAAATNDDRLLDAYLSGDRSDAATAAAAKLLGI